jgi:hypothetical protein
MMMMMMNKTIVNTERSTEVPMKRGTTGGLKVTSSPRPRVNRPKNICEFEDECLLEYCAVWSGRCLPTFNCCTFLYVTIYTCENIQELRHIKHIGMLQYRIIDFF